MVTATRDGLAAKVHGRVEFVLWACWQRRLQDVGWRLASSPGRHSGCDLGPDCVEGTKKRKRKAPEAGFTQAAARALVHLLGSSSHTRRETSDFRPFQKTLCLYKQIQQISWHVFRMCCPRGWTDGFKPYRDLNSLATLPSIGPSPNWFFFFF